jgi:hypothetical protein
VLFSTRAAKSDEHVITFYTQPAAYSTQSAGHLEVRRRQDPRAYVGTSTQQPPRPPYASEIEPGGALQHPPLRAPQARSRVSASPGARQLFTADACRVPAWRRQLHGQRLSYSPTLGGYISAAADLLLLLLGSG